MPRVDRPIANPSLCTQADISAFCDLVRQGDEVEGRGLEVRVEGAKAVACLYVDRQLVGVAALKQPTKADRDRVLRKAGVPDAAAFFDLELGWVFVPEAYRDRKYSRVLSAAALNQSQRRPTGATTRADSIPMQKTLEHLSFGRLGDSWGSERGQRPHAYGVLRTSLGVDWGRGSESDGLA